MTSIRGKIPGLHAGVALLLVCGGAGAEPSIVFDRDIRPILSENCFHCHGPDEATRSAKLRLDTREGILEERRRGTAVVPGDPDSSLLMQRILSEDPDEIMPPPEAKKTVGARERDLLARWIREGADWSEHWSLIPPESSRLPRPPDRAWARNPIDKFVSSKLAEQGLSPAPEADRETLLRRLSLDLTGLPPTPEEVDTFVADTSHDAYERQVERLLASPHYGERMAWPWLDAARYADTNGYQGDAERTMYPWRDWVVRAFNENLPFDEFTVWQLAGDLLPDATEEQRLATGFNRNHMINGEGGRIAEENRIEYVFDQVETVGTVWMGMTLNCCRCHDHKYDPLSHRDYYSLFSFFNQTEVTGAGGNPKTPPVLTLHSEETKAEIASLRAEQSAAAEARTKRRAEIPPLVEAWERTQLERVEAAKEAWATLEVREARAEHQELTIRSNGAVLASGENPANDTYTLEAATTLDTLAAVRLQALRHKTMTEGGLSRSGSGNFVLTDFSAAIVDAAGGETPLEFDTAFASFEQGGFPAANAIDEDPATGWAIYNGERISRNQEAIFLLKEAVAIPSGAALRVTLAHDSIYANHNLGYFRLALSPTADAALSREDLAVAELIGIPADERSEDDNRRITEAFLRSDDTYQQAERRHRRASNRLKSIDDAAAKVMVMEDMTEPRPTYILKTGLYNQPMEEVTADVPEVFFDLDSDAPRNRLGLAEWLVDPRHPLTARVTVNRFWAQFMGQGLVRTAENFGVQGERPSHPKLLDWLAMEFVDSGWDVKALVRLIVTSATYRQSSDSTETKNRIDPKNTYLSRGPRFRMPSWMIRDQALFAGDLFVPEMGGRPVKPYQPDGLWKEFSFGNIAYQRDSGDALYRRSLYTYWRRIVAPPMFFDGSSRQTCTVNEKRTNTPLHALATMNDPTYVEAARALGNRLLAMPEATDEARIDAAFRTVLARHATPEELALLRSSIDRLRGQFDADPEAAAAYLSVGELAPLEEIPLTEQAAYASLCLALFNTDEALTKE